MIKFNQLRLKVNEPEFVGEVAILKVPVVRVGDVSQTSVVRVHTKDGTAKSGTDYAGFSKRKQFVNLSCFSS